MTQTILNGILLDEHTELTLNELCQACSSSAECILELVEEGVLEPVSYQQTQWRFTAVSLTRARTVLHLRRDLGVNLAGAALALELLEEIESLRAQLGRFELID